MTSNRGFNRIIGHDESGFAGRDDQTYHRQAWNFIMSGGGLFPHRDDSFPEAAGDGPDTENEAPGDGNPARRVQLRVLRKFVHHFELASLNPDRDVVTHSLGTITPTFPALGQHYLIYLEGRRPAILPLSRSSGPRRSEWINVLTGAIVHRTTPIADSAPPSPVLNSPAKSPSAFFRNPRSLLPHDTPPYSLAHPPRSSLLRPRGQTRQTAQYPLHFSR